MPVPDSVSLSILSIGCAFLFVVIVLAVLLMANMAPAAAKNQSTQMTGATLLVLIIGTVMLSAGLNLYLEAEVDEAIINAEEAVIAASNVTGISAAMINPTAGAIIPVTDEDDDAAATYVATYGRNIPAANTQITRVGLADPIVGNDQYDLDSEDSLTGSETIEIYAGTPVRVDHLIYHLRGAWDATRSWQIKIFKNKNKEVGNSYHEKVTKTAMNAWLIVTFVRTYETPGKSIQLDTISDVVGNLTVFNTWKKYAKFDDSTPILDKVKAYVQNEKDEWGEFGPWHELVIAPTDGFVKGATVDCFIVIPTGTGQVEIYTYTRTITQSFDIDQLENARFGPPGKVAKFLKDEKSQAIDNLTDMIDGARVLGLFVKIDRFLRKKDRKMHPTLQPKFYDVLIHQD